MNQRRAIVLHTGREAEPACQEWLVYVRSTSNQEDVMIDVSRTADLRTRDEVLRRFAHVPGAYAVPVED